MPLPLPIPLEELEGLSTPLQLYDEQGIRGAVRGLLEAFGAYRGGFRQFYAVKALPNPAILRILTEEGCGLDCSSTSELHIASMLKVPGESIMYTSNYTSASDLGVAFDQGVIINLDDISLIDTLEATRGRLPDLLSFRLNPGLGRTDSETVSNCLGGPNAKFGVPPSQILEAYRRALARGVKRFGIHMMTGSCVLDPDYWLETITRLLETAADIHTQLGITFEFINIGGGLGIPYRPGQSGVDLSTLGPRLVHHIESECERLGFPSLPRLYMENGRYLTGPFGWLISRCHVIKEAFGEVFYGLDACMSNLMRPGMYGSYHHITVPAREGVDTPSLTTPPPSDLASGEGVAFMGRHQRGRGNVVGTLCENNDWFAKVS